MWFKWHLLNLGLKIKSIHGGLKRTAVDEVNNVSKEDEIAIAGGQALHYEREVGSRYYEFWDSSFSNFTRMNLYFFLIVAAVITTIVRFVMGGVNQGGLSEDYLLMSAAGIGGLLLVLFIFEMLRKKSDDNPISEKTYKEACKWMHYISEKARRKMPWWAWTLVSLGLLMEAAAISMIAISYAGDFSKDVAQYAGAFTGLIVAGALGYLIHNAGESLYREHHRKRLLRVIRSEGNKEKNEQGEWISKTYRNLKGSNLDNGSDDYDQTGENVFDVDTKGSNAMMAGAIILILLIAGFAFVQRAALNKTIIEMQGGGDQGSISTILLPGVVIDAQEKSQKDTVNEKISDAEVGMYSGLAILTIVFLLINVVGLMFGYKYCFYNGQSIQFYEDIKKYKEQMHLQVQDALYGTFTRQKVLKKSNQFFSKFQQHAVKQARVAGLDSIKDSLNKRRAYKMETYEKNQRRSV